MSSGTPSAAVSTSTGSGAGPRISTRSSSRSPVPRPCSALTGWGSPSPRRSSSQMAASRSASSTLLATSSTGRPLRRRRLATRLSSSVMPTVTSTTKSTASASAMARSDWRDTFSSRSSPPGIQPPVSTRRNSRPCHSATTSLRSRVTPGFSCDDRHAAADDPVEQRRLADVRSTDDGDRRQIAVGRRRRRRRLVGCRGVGGRVVGVGERIDHQRRSLGRCGRVDGKVVGHRGSSALRRAMPSVGTISTGRGRSSGVVPSRKRPCERHTSGRR